MFRRIMVAIIRLCSYKGKLNTIASSKWFDVEISNTLTLSIMQFTFIRAQPDDGHYDAPKHVVVVSPIASKILLKLVVVIDFCPPIYIIFTHNGNVKP